MKYKLIKEYPGSPKLDSIVEIKNNGGYELENSTSYFMTKDKVENYPEFWKLVVEKDYEILSIIWGSEILKDKDNLDAYNNGYTGKYEIHSVKRLSDSEIFTIGDKCNPIGKYSNNIHPITKIWFCNSGYLRLSSDNYTLAINDIEKSKTPLFTTEDGVDIFEKNWEIYIVDQNLNLRYCNKDFTIPLSKNVKYFHMKEKAEEYILMNKPCLSLKEVLEIVPFLDRSEKKLKELVQQKLNK